MSHYPISSVLSLPPSHLQNGFDASSCWLKHWIFKVHVRSHCFLYLSLSVRLCLNIQTHYVVQIQFSLSSHIIFIKPKLTLGRLSVVIHGFRVHCFCVIYTAIYRVISFKVSFVVCLQTPGFTILIVFLNYLTYMFYIAALL